MGLLNSLRELVKELPRSVVPGGPFALAQEQAEDLLRENAELHKAKATLEVRLVDLESQLAAERAGREFVEARGVLFKRKASGGYELVPFCPNCQTALNSSQGLADYLCVACHFTADFNRRQLEGVMHDLPN